jgi:hypothetical protein
MRRGEMVGISRGKSNVSGEGLARSEPDLITDHCHHKQKVNAESPQDQEFGAFEVTAGDGVLLGFDELVGFEGGEDPGLIGG